MLLDALQKHKAAIDKSVTGAGKTLIACDLAKDLDRPAFVVTPKVGIPMWERELEERGCDYYGVINYEKLRTGKTPYGEWLSPKVWKWNLPEKTFVIFDECQKSKGMNSQNGRMMWGCKPYTTLMLSATAAKDPTEMKALGYLLGLHNLRNFWQWCKLNGCRPGMFGGLQFKGTLDNINKLHKQIFPEHGSGLTFADLAEYFQDTEINTTPLDFGDEMKSVYKEMDDELTALLKKEASDSSSAEALTIRLRARQRSELLKVPYLVDRTYDLLGEGRSVVLFVNFTQTLEALKERIGSVTPVGEISGRPEGVKNRQQAIDDFAEDKLRVMICNVQAGGALVSLHDRRGEFPRAALISPSDNEKEIIQCIGRIHRAGGKTPTQQWVLFAAGTIEEDVQKNCHTKMRQVGVFNEGIDKPEEIWED